MLVDIVFIKTRRLLQVGTRSHHYVELEDDGWTWLLRRRQGDACSKEPSPKILVVSITYRPRYKLDTLWPNQKQDNKCIIPSPLAAFHVIIIQWKIRETEL